MGTSAAVEAAEAAWAACAAAASAAAALAAAMASLIFTFSRSMSRDLLRSRSRPEPMAAAWAEPVSLSARVRTWASCAEVRSIWFWTSARVSEKAAGIGARASTASVVRTNGV